MFIMFLQMHDLSINAQRKFYVLFISEYCLNKKEKEERHVLVPSCSFKRFPLTRTH